MATNVNNFNFHWFRSGGRDGVHSQTWVLRACRGKRVFGGQASSKRLKQMGSGNKEVSSADCYCRSCHCWNEVLGDTWFFSPVRIEFCYWVAVEVFAINEILSWPCSVLRFLPAVAPLAVCSADLTATLSVLSWAS